MEIRNIITFLKVADLLSFTKAAQELGYSQSAVTVQIKQLEKELEVPLFERIGKRITLTSFGHEFLVKAYDVYKSLELAKNFRAELISPKGTLKIGCIESIASSILPKYLTELHKKMPRVQTIVKLAPTEELLEMLDSNSIDIIFFVDKKIFGENYYTEFEKEINVSLVAGNNYKLQKKDIYTVEDISNEDFIFTEGGISYNKELENFFASGNHFLHPFLEIGNTDIIIKMLKNNSGISLLPEYAVSEELSNKTLRKINVENMCLKSTMQLMYNKNKWITPQMEEFIKITKAYGDDK